MIDLRQERLRKSDHLNPLADMPDLERVARACGFRIARITFYTPIVGGFVENILMRMAERAMARRAARRIDPSVSPGDVDARAVREARTSAKAQIARSPATYAVLRALSFAMKLDSCSSAGSRRGRSSRCSSRTAQGSRLKAQARACGPMRSVCLHTEP